MHVLITGGAGFIGAALCHHLLARGIQITCVDNLNDYYEVAIKQARLARLESDKGFTFHKLDITDRDGMAGLFAAHRFDVVVNLAAQVGVRASLNNPTHYIDTNLVGFGNVLEGCRQSAVGRLVYASSSSVYGGNTRMPFFEHHATDHPVSLYAATKKANELMAHTYAHLYGLPTTGLRFFTVYGPWGRPDMAFFKFTRLILRGEKIPLYNNGQLTRDFIYIDDMVAAIMRAIEQPATADPEFDADSPTPATSFAPHRLYNIGTGNRVPLMDYVRALEEALGVKAQYEMLPMQPGDVTATCAGMTRLQQDFDFIPTTPVADGLARFVAWYRDYYGY